MPDVTRGVNSQTDDILGRILGIVVLGALTGTYFTFGNALIENITNAVLGDAASQGLLVAIKTVIGLLLVIAFLGLAVDTVARRRS